MKICKVKGCENQWYSKEWCRKHYYQLVRKGVFIARNHGGSKLGRFWEIWIKINRRINNTHCLEYKHYGGRGIKSEWKTFREFKNDMHTSYIDHVKAFGEKQTSIERKDVNGNYCKENCIWATPLIQARNTRRNHLITYQGKTQCLSAWEEELKLPYALLAQRINKLHWDPIKALTTPLR